MSSLTAEAQLQKPECPRPVVHTQRLQGSENATHRHAGSPRLPRQREARTPQQRPGTIGKRDDESMKNTITTGVTYPVMKRS